MLTAPFSYLEPCGIIERQQICWKHACLNYKGCDLETLDTGDVTQPNTTVVNIVNRACPIDSPNATIYNFGIYLYAHQSGMTRSTKFIPKMLHGFWWGLRNLRFAITILFDFLFCFLSNDFLCSFWQN